MATPVDGGRQRWGEARFKLYRNGVATLPPSQFTLNSTYGHIVSQLPPGPVAEQPPWRRPLRREPHTTPSSAQSGRRDKENAAIFEWYLKENLSSIQTSLSGPRLLCATVAPLDGRNA